MAGHDIKLNWEVLFLQMLYTQQKQVLPFLDHGEFDKGHVRKNHDRKYSYKGIWKVYKTMINI